MAKLVRLQDPTTTTALEVAAGGKLYQVVVDTVQTSQALLSHGKLQNRVTIIPLNKVRSTRYPGFVHVFCILQTPLTKKSLLPQRSEKLLASSQCGSCL